MELPQAPITGVTSGAQVPITAKTWARGVTIAEDATGAMAGLAITFPNGKTINVTPAQYPFLLAGIVPPVNGSPFVGQPASSVGGGGNSATQYCTVESLGATTVVQIIEYN